MLTRRQINTPRRIAAEDPFVDSRSPAQNQGDEAGPGGDEGPNETVGPIDSVRRNVLLTMTAGSRTFAGGWTWSPE